MPIRLKGKTLSIIGGTRPSVIGRNTPLSTLAADVDTFAAGLEIGIGRCARRAYGFDEVALVPGQVTINPEEGDITFRLGDRHLELPIWGSTMYGLV